MLRSLSPVTFPIKKFPSSSVCVKIQGFQVCPWLLSSHVYEDSEVIGKIPSGRFSSCRGSTASYLLPKENVCDAWHIVKHHCAYNCNGDISFYVFEKILFLINPIFNI